VQAGSQGTAHINSGGTVTTTSSAWVGGGWSAAGGTGVLHVNSDGTLNIAGVLGIWNAVGNQVNLNGGTINTFNLNFDGNPTLLNWTSGTLNITNSVTFDSAAPANTTSAAFGASRTLGTGQTLKITGSETLGGTGAFALTVNSGGTHTVTNNLTVTHKGTLTINSGGTVMVPSGGVFIGESATTPATVSVTGSGASLQTATTTYGGGVSVGNTGRGVLNISSGASVSATSTAVGPNLSGDVLIGAFDTGVGEVTVTGTASNLQAAGGVVVGLAGQGTMNVTDGGAVSITTTAGDPNSGFLAVGTNSGSTGQLSVSGPNSSVQAAAVVNIGNSNGANGTLTIGSGGVLRGAVINFGTATGAVGQGTVAGAGSLLMAQGATNENVVLRVGRAGQGTLTLSDMAVASANMTAIGRDPTGVGQVTVSGGASLQTSQFLSVGTSWTAPL
jgi:T5SS/PEP-CTERM-associated repeat protein